MNENIDEFDYIFIDIKDIEKDIENDIEKDKKKYIKKDLEKDKKNIFFDTSKKLCNILNISINVAYTINILYIIFQLYNNPLTYYIFSNIGYGNMYILYYIYKLIII